MKHKIQERPIVCELAASSPVNALSIYRRFFVVKVN